MFESFFKLKAYSAETLEYLKANLTLIADELYLEWVREQFME